jgi:hypothetical protein
LVSVSAAQKFLVFLSICSQFFLVFPPNGLPSGLNRPGLVVFVSFTVTGLIRLQPERHQILIFQAAVQGRLPGSPPPLVWVESCSICVLSLIFSFHPSEAWQGVFVLVGLLRPFLPASCLYAARADLLPGVSSSCLPRVFPVSRTGPSEIFLRARVSVLAPELDPTVLFSPPVRPESTTVFKNSTEQKNRRQANPSHFTKFGKIRENSTKMHLMNERNRNFLKT